ncbi:SGNH/GDSL hydrolase family protein [Opitutales bacterium]|nr:SGNH/GDSL hydrolase family protein [Opitutales bacterium]
MKAFFCIAILLNFVAVADTGAKHTPSWLSKKMVDEPVLFIGEEGNRSGRLIFTPASMPGLTRAGDSFVYEAGKDYTWEKGSRTIRLTDHSRIPSKTAQEMRPGPGKPRSLGGVLHGEGRFFHDLQTLVSYSHNQSWPDLVQPGSATLPRSLEKLNSSQSFKVVTLGDSITEGYNASGFAKTQAPRNQPSYAEGFARLLDETFPAQVTLSNLGVAGRTAVWGLKQLDRVIAEKPDLVIIAFGMNDPVSFEQFQRTNLEILTHLQKEIPQTDMIFVSGMNNNPDWRDPTKIPGFRETLKDIIRPNIILADITTPWEKLLTRKNFSDLSGNNVNHPNDFGHRLYSEILFSLFISP